MSAQPQKAVWSDLHKRYVVAHPSRPALIIGSGTTKETALQKARSYCELHSLNFQVGEKH